MSAEPLVSVLHTDPENPHVRWVTVDRWPAETLLEPALMDFRAHGASIWFEGRVTVTVRNGSAVYQVVGWDADAHAMKLELVSWLGPLPGDKADG